MPVLGNLVHETSTTSGVDSPLTIAREPGMQRIIEMLNRFSLGVGDNGADNPILFISNRDVDDEWAVVQGYLSDEDSPSGGTLVIASTLQSSNGDAAVTWSAGTKDITNAVPADNLLYTTDGILTLPADDAGNNAVSRPLVVKHTTSGTPTTGIGAGIRFDVETATAENIEQAGAIDVVATDVTGASEDFDFVGRLMAGGAAIAEVFRITSIGVMTLAANAAKIVLHAAGGQTLTGGFKATPYAAGTKSSGTYTPLYSDGNFQTATNGGAHTLAPPADDCTIIVQYTNNGSAGAITTSGFSKVNGAFTTTNGDDFFAYITKVGSFSHLYIQALQ